MLCGRELAISTMNKDYKFKYVFPLIGKDFVKMVFGLSVSVVIPVCDFASVPRAMEVWGLTAGGSALCGRPCSGLWV